MKFLVALCFLLAVSPAFALGTFLFDLPTYQFELTYDVTSFSPGELNDARKSIHWNGTTPSGGTFDKAGAMSFAFGTSAFIPGYLSLQYSSATQELPLTSIQGTSTAVTDRFVMETVYLLYDFPFETREFVVSLGGGIGYANRFELHQDVSGSVQEDDAWSAHPIAFKIRLTAGHALGNDNVRVFGRLQYESISSELRARNHFSVNSVSDGDFFKDGSGRVATADLSGWRYGVGLSIVF